MAKETDDKPINLKLILMRLGDRLVTEQGFNPGWLAMAKNRGEQMARTKDTEALQILAEFLNNSPEARELLEQMGFSWPTVEKRDETEIPYVLNVFNVAKPRGEDGVPFNLVKRRN